MRIQILQQLRWRLRRGRHRGSAYRQKRGLWLPWRPRNTSSRRRPVPKGQAFLCSGRVWCRASGRWSCWWPGRRHLLHVRHWLRHIDTGRLTAIVTMHCLIGELCATIWTNHFRSSSICHILSHHATVLSYHVFRKLSMGFHEFSYHFQISKHTSAPAAAHSWPSQHNRASKKDLLQGKNPVSKSFSR